MALIITKKRGRIKRSEQVVLGGAHKRKRPGRKGALGEVVNVRKKKISGER